MERDYLISNRTYGILLRVVTIVLPGFAALYVGLSDAWDLSNVREVVLTITAIATLGGLFLWLADKSWNNSESKFDGAITTKGYDEITGNPDLALHLKLEDPRELATKDFIRLKSIDESV